MYIPYKILAVSTKRELLEESWNKLVVLYFKHIFLAKRPLTSETLGLLLFGPIVVVVSFLVRHGTAANRNTTTIRLPKVEKTASLGRKMVIRGIIHETDYIYEVYTDVVKQ